MHSTEGDYSIAYNNGKGNVSIDFNICEYAFRKCPDAADDFANIINENNTCNHLSNDAIAQVGVSLIDSANPALGLRLNFATGNQCNDTSKYNMQIQMNCDEYAVQSSY